MHLLFSFYYTLQKYYGAIHTHAHVHVRDAHIPVVVLFLHALILKNDVQYINNYNLAAVAVS